MKNKNQFLSMCIMVLACVFVFTSCKKKETGTADPNAKQHNEDVSNTKSESDNVNTDVNTVLNGITGTGKTDETNAAISICGATIDSSQQNGSPKTIIIHFDGTTACGNPARIRGGDVKIELINGNRWSDLGAVLKITHIAYKVTFVNLNNHFLTFNGVKYLTNVTGFDWLTYVFNGGNISATIKERTNNTTVTFENDSTDSWNSARLTTWAITGYTHFTATVEADTLMDGKKIDSWGTSRFGTQFKTEMITPWKSGTDCGWWRPTQGKYISTTANFSITATASVDQEGNVVSTSCGGYGYKLEWNYNSGTATGNVVIPYF
ncbi:MAG: hypothetical protein NTY88_05380 [Bacteroidetes bacterium]|nr:hypothetical protein [Bacteroidota bacterium]